MKYDYSNKLITTEKALEFVQSGWDIVVVARTRAIHASFEKLTESYLSAAAKAGILKELP